MRTMVHVVESNVISNKYLAGVHILGGAGDVNLTRTSVGDNFGDGVNVSYAGGRVNLTSCNLARNVGRGLAVWWNESSTVRPFDHYVVVAYSTVDGNGGIGVSFGNFCQPVVVNVTYTHFRKGLDVGLKVDTCWRHLTDSSVEAPLRLFVTHNKFMNHTKPSLVVSPAVNLKGIVMFNHFQGNSGGSLLIQNPSEIEELESLPAEVEVSENTFRNNKGSFVVAIGLSQYSLVQQLRFMGNDLKDNGVSEPFVGLTPRHRVAAVVTVSSSNVRIKRNLFENQDSSKYDIGSHLIDRYAAIDASLCYFGKYGGEYPFGSMAWAFVCSRLGV